MFKATPAIAAVATILAAATASATTYQACNSAPLNVLSINTWSVGGSSNNSDGNQSYSVKLSDNKYYTASSGCNSNDACGQANLSLLLAAFAAGNKVTLYGGDNGCPTFWGVTLTP